MFNLDDSNQGNPPFPIREVYSEYTMEKHYTLLHIGKCHIIYTI